MKLLILFNHFVQLLIYDPLHSKQNSEQHKPLNKWAESLLKVKNDNCDENKIILYHVKQLLINGPSQVSQLSSQQ